MPRSFAQRRTNKIRLLARPSMLSHSLTRDALYSGVTQFTEKSIGMLMSETPNAGGAISVTFGSCPRKAERRNLKPPTDTSWSVQARIADFCSFRASRRAMERPPLERRPWRRWIRAEGLARATRSSSGTATPNAVPRTTSPLAKPMISTSGKTSWIAFRAQAASLLATCSDSALGFSSSASSSTCASKPLAAKRGGATGILLSCRSSGRVAAGDRAA
mmetsp:Transcript_84514/g.217703  ORF Transcript_84514/g.217703 Transcript_84514/m.217703 type:complete len:218 (-) Transcript_84514:425-1078(-)